MQPEDLDIMAREVNQPLDALSLLSRALRQRIEKGEPEAILGEIDTGLTQLRRQIASLVDVLRVERCLAHPNRIEFPLAPVFEKVSLQATGMATANGVRLSVVPTSARVKGDPQAIEVILRNLVINGLFYAPGGRVLLGCRSRGDDVEILVCDNGIGIHPENHDVIFEPLRRLEDGADGSTPGLGVGLTLSRALARSLGYALDLRSEPSVGSIFSVTVPRVWH